MSEGQEKVTNLKKDVAEMREWMIQVDEEFLMRDFEYKSPEELEEALQEMKVLMGLAKYPHITTRLLTLSISCVWCSSGREETANVCQTSDYLWGTLIVLQKCTCL